MSATTVPLRPLARRSVLKLWLGLAVLALAAAGLAWIGTRGQQVTTTDSGLRYRVLEEGDGPTVTPADLVALRYQLRKEDGTLIEDSDQSGQPFVTGTEGLFPGFSEGLQLMQAGGRYRLWIPPGLHVQQATPPGTPFSREDTLVFDIEVLQIAPGMAAMRGLMGPPGAGPPEGGEPGGDAAPPGRDRAPEPAAVAPAAPAGNRQ